MAEATRMLSLEAREPVEDPRQGSLFFVGTATCILRAGGFTLLTDPNFLHRGDHIHVGFGVTSTRLTDPAIDIEQLPPIDLVLLSHMHDDHFDKLVQERLDHVLPIVTTPHAAAKLHKRGFHNTEPLRAWESLTLTRGDRQLRITSMPARHGPGVLNALLPETMGSMLDFGPRGGEPDLRVYVTGDTLIHDALEEIPARFPHIDLCVLHLGGTRVMGLMLTMDAESGVRMLRIVAPRVAVPVHYDDYPLFKSPLSDFVKAVDRAELDTRIHYVHRGDTYRFELWPAGGSRRMA